MEHATICQQASTKGNTARASRPGRGSAQRHRATHVTRGWLNVTGV